MILDDGVVDEPTAAGRVRVVVAVAQRQWPITTAAPRHWSVAQVGRGRPVARMAPFGAEPRQSERVVAPGLRFRGQSPVARSGRREPQAEPG